MPAINDLVSYRSIAGSTYDARITTLRPNGNVDIEVDPPGCAKPLALTNIRFIVPAGGPVDTYGAAFPRPK